MLEPKITVHKNLLTREHLTSTLRTVFDLEPLWHRREERLSYRNAPYYTLGAPMYLDVNGPNGNWETYREKAKFFNTVLLKHFKPIYDFIRLIESSSTEFIDGCSIPGFHIFPPHMTGSYFFGRMHEDAQWRNFARYEGDPYQPESQFSFTYVLKLPSAGGGLFVANEGHYYPYEENALYVHSGQFLHAIAPTPGPMLPCDWRITLQGHGFYKGDHAYLYW